MAPALGRCGVCIKQFQSAAYAYKCVACGRNFHPECLQLGPEYASDSGVFRALRDTGSIACKSCRETEVTSRRTIDANEYQQVLEANLKLTEEKKSLERRMQTVAETAGKQAEAAARQAGEDLQKKLESAKTKIGQLETAMSIQSDQRTLENVQTMDREIQKARQENQRLLNEGRSLQEKYNSLKKRFAEAMNNPNLLNQAMNVDPEPSTSADPQVPVIVTTANMRELIMNPILDTLREIQHEVSRLNRAEGRTPRAAPRLDSSTNRRTTFAAVAAQPRRRSVSVRKAGPTPAEAAGAKSTAAAKKKLSTEPLKKSNPLRTRAAVLASQPIDMSNRFTILTTDTDLDEEESIALLSAIQSDKQLADITNLIDIQRRSKRSMYVETETAEGAEALKTAITQKYPSASIKNAAVKRPQLRITGCPVAEYTAEDIQSQNKWLTSAVSIDRFYDAGTGVKKYRNIIISCSLDDQLAAIEAGRMLIGFSACRVHEYNDVIQCRQCWRYGHYRHSCKFAPLCRICGKGQHTDEVCNAPRDSCANCVRHNKTHEEKVPINH